MKRAAGASVTVGERVVGAFVGALWGLVVGGILYGAIFLGGWTQGAELPPPSIVWTTVAWSAAFTFVFGDALGDVMTMFYRIYVVMTSRYMTPKFEEDARWLWPIAMFFLYTVPLIFILRHLAT